jgi:hypothetical protein
MPAPDRRFVLDFVGKAMTGAAGEVRAAIQGLDTAITVAANEIGAQVSEWLAMPVKTNVCDTAWQVEGGTPRTLLQECTNLPHLNGGTFLNQSSPF